MINTLLQTVQRRGPRVEFVSSPSPDCSSIVAGIRQNRSESFEQLDSMFRSGVEFFLRRSGASASSIGRLADDCFGRVRTQIVEGVILDPAELPKLVRTTLQSLMAKTSSHVLADPQTEQGKRVLEQMSGRAVEALQAYFIAGETVAAICARLSISEQEFEQYRAEAKFLFRALPSQLPQRELRIG